jgi:hypothetical protein
VTAADETPVTVAEMLRRIEAGRAELDRALALATGPSEAGWTPKDQLAHIACWERSALALLNAEERMAHVGLERGAHEALGESGVNDHIYTFYRDMPDSEVRELYEQVHADLVAKLRTMSDEDLLKPYSHYQPNDPPYNANPVWPWIVGNTFGHYEEHIEYMRNA